MNININIDTPRGWLNISSTNNSKESLVHSSVSPISCAERVKALNNNLSWVKQVEANPSQDFSLSYATPKERRNTTINKTITPTNMPEPYGEHVEYVNTNTCYPQ